jgi:hypothetical protein
MYKPKTIIATLIAALAFSAVVVNTASAAWFIEDEELTSTAALATTAKVSEEPTLSFGTTIIKCSGSTLNSVKPEIMALNQITAASLSFSGCSVTSSGECALIGTTIGTLPITAELTEQTYPEEKATFTPRTGTTFATIKLEGSNCAETGKVPVTGKAATALPTGQEENKTQSIKADTTKASGELKVGSTSAELTGAAGFELATGNVFGDLAITAKPRSSRHVGVVVGATAEETFTFTNDTKVKWQPKARHLEMSEDPATGSKITFEDNGCLVSGAAANGGTCKVKIKIEAKSKGTYSGEEGLEAAPTIRLEVVTS